MHTAGKDNGIFTYKLQDTWEVMLVDIYFLSLQNNGMEMELNYLIVKDYCKKEKLEVFEIWRILKTIKSRLKSKN